VEGSSEEKGEKTVAVGKDDPAEEEVLSSCEAMQIIASHEGGSKNDPIDGKKTFTGNRQTYLSAKKI